MLEETLIRMAAVPQGIEAFITSNGQSVGIEDCNLKNQSDEYFNLEQRKHQHEDKPKTIMQLQRERDAAISVFSRYRDQLSALDEAVSLINKLITPSPSALYRTKVQLPVSPLLSQTAPASRHKPLNQRRSVSETRQVPSEEIREELEDENLLIQNQLDHLNSSWKLEETNIPSLLESIRAMQSRNNLLSNENDAMSSEIKSLRQSLSEAEKVNVECMKGSKIMTAKLQHVAEKLYEENKKVNLKLKKAKEYVCCIRLKENFEKEKLLAVMLNIHEEMMRTKIKERKLNSNFECEEIPYQCSTVTKDGRAVVRFSSKEDSGLRNNSEAAVDEIIEINKMISIENQINMHTYVEVKEVGKESGEHVDEHILFFPSGTKKVGLRFQKVPISDDTETEKVFQSSKKSRDLILVCGVTGFDTSLNVVPSIGARLVAIDGVALTASNPMNLSDVKRKVSSKVSAGDSFSLVFRNIDLSCTQRKLLMKGVQSMNVQTAKKTLVPSSKENRKIRIKTEYHV